MNINRRVSVNVVSRAAQRVMRARFDRETAHRNYISHIKGLKDSKEIHDDSLTRELRFLYDLSEANLTSALVAQQSVSTLPPLT